MIRCDQCDNRIIPGWSYCAYCGYPQTGEGLEAAQREITERLQTKETIAKLAREIGVLRSAAEYHAGEGVAEASFWEDHFSKPKNPTGAT